MRRHLAKETAPTPRLSPWVPFGIATGLALIYLLGLAVV